MMDNQKKSTQEPSPWFREWVESLPKHDPFQSDAQKLADALDFIHKKGLGDEFQDWLSPMPDEIKKHL